MDWFGSQYNFPSISIASLIYWIFSCLVLNNGYQAINQQQQFLLRRLCLVLDLCNSYICACMLSVLLQNKSINNQWVILINLGFTPQSQLWSVGVALSIFQRGIQEKKLIWFLIQYFNLPYVFWTPVVGVWAHYWLLLLHRGYSQLHL